MEREKVAIITGSGRGIGAATARLLAAQGYAVCINYRNNQSAALELLEQIQDTGARAIAIQADISVEAQVMELFHKVDHDLGRVSALVNNAGILAPQMRLDRMDATRINRMLSSNVTGYFLCCREAVKRMSSQHGGAGGAIVNVSSVAARTGSPGEYIDYAASKGAIDSLTIGLAAEVASEGVRVNAVRPGFIHTQMHADGGEPRRIERLREAIPMKRGGKAEEVAEAIIWLLSDKASYTTGSFIDLAGGR
ncbi:SDR family oxidoreductase [Amphritea sp. HPY]|uniref:SDR family oxidoreductase n=1 Tax=Amphritea sp. HPY TaxID=3421652 RepID=UPI003D7E7F6A